MNYRGSYRHFIRNSRSAALAAMELYNKPRIDYRDELVVILLINAWELALKALLSKNGRSVYYPKERGQAYKTLSWQDALTRGQDLLPGDLAPLPIRKNLELLTVFRNNAIHFYNAQGFRTLLYALAQTSLVNYRDLLAAVFAIDVGSDISWLLLPLGLSPPVDPVEYITQQRKKPHGNAAVRQFLNELAIAQNEVVKAGGDAGRLLTQFTVSLQSTKKLGKADVVVGIKKATEVDGPLAFERSMDPNVTHPYRQKEVLERLPMLHGRPFTSHVFQAIVWKFQRRIQPVTATTSASRSDGVIHPSVCLGRSLSSRATASSWR